MAIKDNFGNPKGFMGRLMLSGMNIGHSPMTKWAFTQFDVPDDGKLVDIGCAGGFNIRRLLEHSANGFVYGVDISSTSVEKSKKKNKKNLGKRCDVLVGSADNLPLEDNSIKLATAFETVYFWDSLEKCFAEVKRTLEAGGTFVVVNDPGDPEKHWERMIPGMKAYTPEDIQTAMEAVGFTEIRITRKKIHVLRVRKERRIIMKYGFMGNFVSFAFSKTAFEFIEKEIPELDMADYKKCVKKEYKAIVKRTPGIGKMKDNMFVMTMYAGAFLIALYKEAKDYMTDELLQKLVKTLTYSPMMVKSKQGKSAFTEKEIQKQNEAVKMI